MESAASEIPGQSLLLDQIIERLARVFQPRRIVLFGSRANGSARAESDVDLLVVADSGDPVHVRMALAQRALRGLAVAADVFVVTPEEVDRYGSWLSHTVAIALREGKVIYAAG
jgi:predicted nucleotidyltransferase